MAVVIGLLLCSLFTYLFSFRVNQLKSLQAIFLFLLSISVGFNLAYFCAKDILNGYIPQQWYGQKITIEGKIIDLVNIGPQSAKFILKVSKACYENECHDVNTKLKLYHRTGTQLDVFRPHAKLNLLIKLKRPVSYANPGSPDFEKHLFFQGIQASGQVLAINKSNYKNKISLLNLRMKILNKMDILLDKSEYRGIIEALTLGVRWHVTKAQWQAFRDTGTSHLIAISGLHVGLVATFCFFLSSYFFSRFHQLTLLRPAQCWGAMGAMLGAFVYAALAGFSIPTQRAFIMVLFFMVALLMRRNVSSMKVLALSLIVIILYSPLSVMSVGFWLSYLAVFLLIVFSRYKTFSVSKLKLTISIQLALFVGLLPFNILFFDNFSLFAPVANLIAIPLVSLFIVPVVLMGLILMGIFESLSGGLFWLADITLGLLMQLLQTLDNLPYAYLPLSFQSVGLWVLFLVGCFAFLILHNIKLKFFSLICCLPLIFCTPTRLNYGDIQFSLLDVGQGLSAVIQTKSHALLYDAGPKIWQKDMGEQVVVPFLKKQKIRNLDTILISHADMDHIGGFASVAKALSFDEILTPDPNAIEQYEAKKCQAGRKWQWDGVSFEILHPGSEKIKKKNNTSCVLKVSTGSQNLLLVGDIEKQIEVSMLNKNSKALASTILVVPHHGSKTSSCEKFVTHLQPEYALFAVGKGNHYGFPKVEILERYQKIGAQTLISYDTGAMMFYITPSKINAPILFREKSRRFWHQL